MSYLHEQYNTREDVKRKVQKWKKLMQFAHVSSELTVNWNTCSKCNIECSGKLILEPIDKLLLHNESSQGLFVIKMAMHHHTINKIELELKTLDALSYNKERAAFINSNNNNNNDNYDSSQTEIHDNCKREREIEKAIITNALFDLKPIDKECIVYNVECDVCNTCMTSTDSITQEHVKQCEREQEMCAFHLSESLQRKPKMLEEEEIESECYHEASLELEKEWEKEYEQKAKENANTLWNETNEMYNKDRRVRFNSDQSEKKKDDTENDSLELVLEFGEDGDNDNYDDSNNKNSNEILERKRRRRSNMDINNDRLEQEQEHLEMNEPLQSIISCTSLVVVESNSVVEQECQETCNNTADISNQDDVDDGNKGNTYYRKETVNQTQEEFIEENIIILEKSKIDKKALQVMENTNVINDCISQAVNNEYAQTNDLCDQEQLVPRRVLHLGCTNRPQRSEQTQLQDVKVEEYWEQEWEEERANNKTADDQNSEVNHVKCKNVNECKVEQLYSEEYVNLTAETVTPLKVVQGEETDEHYNKVKIVLQSESLTSEEEKEEQEEEEELFSFYLCTVELPSTNEIREEIVQEEYEVNSSESNILKSSDNSNRSSDNNNNHYDNNFTNTIYYISKVIVHYEHLAAISENDVNELEGEHTCALSEHLLKGPNYIVFIGSNDCAFLLCPILYTLHYSSNDILLLSNPLTNLVERVMSAELSALQVIALHSFPISLSTVHLLLLLDNSEHTLLNKHDKESLHLPFATLTNDFLCSNLSLEPESKLPYQNTKKVFRRSIANNCAMVSFCELAEHCVRFVLIQKNYSITYYYLGVDHTCYWDILQKAIVNILEYVKIEVLHDIKELHDSEHQETELSETEVNTDAARLSQKKVELISPELCNSAHSSAHQSTEEMHSTTLEQLTVIVSEFSNTCLALRGGISALTPHVVIISSSTLRSLCNMKNTRSVFRATCALTYEIVHSRLHSAFDYNNTNNTDVRKAKYFCEQNSNIFCNKMAMRATKDKWWTQNVISLDDKNVVSYAVSYALALEYVWKFYVFSWFTIIVAKVINKTKSQLLNNCNKNICEDEHNISFLEWQNYLREEGELTNALTHFLHLPSLLPPEHTELLSQLPLHSIDRDANNKLRATLPHCIHNLSKSNVKELTKQCKCKHWGINLYTYFFRQWELLQTEYSPFMESDMSILWLHNHNQRRQVLVKKLLQLCTLEAQPNRANLQQRRNELHSLLYKQDTCETKECSEYETDVSSKSEIVFDNAQCTVIKGMTANNASESRLKYDICPWSMSASMTEWANNNNNNNNNSDNTDVEKNDNCNNSSSTIHDALYWKVSLTCHSKRENNYVGSSNKDNNIYENNAEKISNLNANINTESQTITMPLLFLVFAIYNTEEMSKSKPRNREVGDSNSNSNNNKFSNNVIHNNSNVATSEQEGKVDIHNEVVTKDNACLNFNMPQTQGSSRSNNNNNTKSSKLPKTPVSISHCKLVQAIPLSWNWEEHCSHIDTAAYEHVERTEFVIFNEWARNEAEKYKIKHNENERGHLLNKNKKRRRRETSIERLEKRLRWEVGHTDRAFAIHSNNAYRISTNTGEINEGKNDNTNNKLSNTTEQLYKQERREKGNEGKRKNSNVTNDSKNNCDNMHVTLLPFICVDNTALSPLSRVEVELRYKDNKQLSAMLINFARMDDHYKINNNNNNISNINFNNNNNKELQYSELHALLSHLIGFTTFHAAYPHRVHHAREIVMPNHANDLEFDFKKLTLFSEEVISTFRTLLNSLLLMCLDYVTDNDDRTNEDANNNIRDKQSNVASSQGSSDITSSKHNFTLTVLNDIISSEEIIRATVNAAHYYRRKSLSIISYKHDDNNKCGHIATQKEHKHVPLTEDKMTHVSVNKRHQHKKRELQKEQHNEREQIYNSVETNQREVLEKEYKIAKEHQSYFKNNNSNSNSNNYCAADQKNSMNSMLLLDSHIMLHAFWQVVMYDRVMHRLAEKLPNAQLATSLFDVKLTNLTFSREELQMRHVIAAVHDMWRKHCHKECILEQSTKEDDQIEKQKILSSRKLSLRLPVEAKQQLLKLSDTLLLTSHTMPDKSLQSTQVSKIQETWPRMSAKIHFLRETCEKIINEHVNMLASDTDQDLKSISTIQSLWLPLQLITYIDWDEEWNAVNTKQFNN